MREARQTKYCGSPTYSAAILERMRYGSQKAMELLSGIEPVPVKIIAAGR